jgi:hypothetical protein
MVIMVVMVVDYNQNVVATTFCCDIILGKIKIHDYDKLLQIFPNTQRAFHD